LIDTNRIESILSWKAPEGTAFESSDVNLTDYFASSPEDTAEDEEIVEELWLQEVERKPLNPRYPKDTAVVAIDSTSFVLGQISDGVVGAIRASVVTKPAGEPDWNLERYGPHIVTITEQVKDEFYRELHRVVYDTESSPRPPDLVGTLDQARNLFERYLQLEVVKQHKESLVLLDGSLIAAPLAESSSFIQRLVSQAAENVNSLVAVSKTTKLVLERSRRSILSLLEGAGYPCYVGGIRRHIRQSRDRYLGEIYVTRFTPTGEAFRVDLPDNTPVSHEQILNSVSGLAGDYGYPEELRLAHMTCVLSAIEILELQSAAIALHNLVVKDESRTRLFPI